MRSFQTLNRSFSYVIATMHKWEDTLKSFLPSIFHQIFTAHVAYPAHSNEIIYLCHFQCTAQSATHTPTSGGIPSPNSTWFATSRICFISCSEYLPASLNTRVYPR